MVPGIHNLATVGSSPLKRGIKTIADNNRDYHYINNGSAAGALSSKVNIKKVFLPAMDREHNRNRHQSSLITPNADHLSKSRQQHLHH